MLRNYLIIAFRVFLRRKFFTFISLFAISFTLVVLMVTVAMFDHAFGVHSPESRQERSLGVFFLELKSPTRDSTRNGNAGYGFLTRYVKTMPSIEKLAILSESEEIQTFHNSERVPLYLKRTDGAFWEIMDFKFIEGAPYSQADDDNRSAVAVINRATRDRLFGNVPAVGKTVDLDGTNFRVVGVVENVPFLRYIPFSDVWVPIGTIRNDSYRKELVGDFIGLILARSKADFPAIKEEFQSRVASVEFPDPKRWNYLKSSPETFFEFMSRQIIRNEQNNAQPGKLVAAMILGCLLFMLLPTINLANINVSRIMERASEIGVRKAFGASSRILVGQFVVENVLLTLVGGVIALFASLGVLSLISRTNLFPYAEFHLNYRIFLVGLGIAVFFGLFSGVYPAWRMSRLHPVQALKG